MSELNQPPGVSILTSAEYLITDRGNHQLLLCSPLPNPTCTTVAGLGGQGNGRKQRDNQLSVAIDAEYVRADSVNHRVQLFSAMYLGANFSTVAGTGESGSSAVELNEPTGVVVS